MDPRIRIGAVVVGALLVVGSRLLARLRRVAIATQQDGDDTPLWVAGYTYVAFGILLIVGGVTVDARWAVLSFVVALFGLTAVKLISNIRAGGYGGEE